jgi:cysteine desulfurase
MSRHSSLPADSYFYEVIYLDYNATTPVDDEVLNEMLPYFSDRFGNAASSTHLFGALAKDAVELARSRIAEKINCDIQEVIFTSGSTEGINFALKGIFHLYRSKGNHIVTVSTEHKAVLDTCKYLEKKGADITRLPVDENGSIDLDALDKSIHKNTIAVSIMYANNETGVIHPVREIAKIIHDRQSIFVCDATQAAGKIPVDVQHDGIDVLCISAHKFYGPKGTGAVYIRRKNPRVSIEPLIHGGGHERGLRSGTLNVPGIVGMGKAIEGIHFNNDMETLRNNFEQQLLKLPGNAIGINGRNAPRLPNTSNITFPFRAVDFIRQAKEKVAIATGSACTSAENLPSHVLTAMGRTKSEAERSIRFSLGKKTTADDIKAVVRIIEDVNKMFGAGRI